MTFIFLGKAPPVRKGRKPKPKTTDLFSPPTNSILQLNDLKILSPITSSSNVYSSSSALQPSTIDVTPPINPICPC
jgi:hypothetical protein